MEASALAHARQRVLTIHTLIPDERTRPVAHAGRVGPLALVDVRHFLGGCAEHSGTLDDNIPLAELVLHRERRVGEPWTPDRVTDLVTRIQPRYRERGRWLHVRLLHLDAKELRG